MPTHKQGIVKEIKPHGPDAGKTGYSYSANLALGFPASPIHTTNTNKKITDISLADFYIHTLNKANENLNPDFPEGVDMNYSGAPSYKDVKSQILGGLEGYPASPFVPNPTNSPDNNAHNPLFKGAPPDNFRKDGGPHKQFRSVSSQGTDLSPNDSAEKISKTDFTNLKMGQSPS